MTDTTTPSPTFQCLIPVRWGDLDAFNHVNNASYLRYVEEARLQWLHSFIRDWNDLRARQAAYRTEEGQALKAYEEANCACHR